MNGHLAESMLRDGARERVGWHLENGFKYCPSFVPLARVMAIEFAQVAQGRRVCRVHAMREAVKLFGLSVSGIHFSHEASAHGSLNTCAQARVENGRVWNFSRLADAEFLQLLRSLFGLLREHAFLVEHRVEELDGSLTVASLRLVSAIFHARIERILALLHLAL